jgi:uncharacterized protein involved in type VI secretion and phage assembly
VNAGLLALERLSQTDQTGSRSCRLVVGIVSDTKDPQGIGRVKVTIPHENNFVPPWARVAAPMAGNDRGCYFPMQANDEVLVAIVGGDARHVTCEAYVLGVMWNGKDKPPVDNSQGENDVCVIKSRGGDEIRISDAEGDKSIQIVCGDNSIRIDKESNTVTITSAGDITLSAKNGKITLDAKTVHATATGEAKLQGDTADVSGNNGLKLHGSSVDIN